MTAAPSIGRERNAQTNERRTRALDAFIDLVLEHGTHPRPEAVAQRADVSIASLYRYFTDLAELRQDAAARLMERFPELFLVAEIGVGERNERIESFTASRMALHDALHPLQLLARAKSWEDPSAKLDLEAVRSVMTEQIRQHFEAELQTVSRTVAEDVATTIAVLTSVESWDQFRSQQRTPVQTRRAWTEAIDRLLPRP